jgi:hypothetical protein
MKNQVRSASLLRRLLEGLKRIVRRNPEPRKPEPEDPYSYRGAPLRRPPRDRSGAAVADLDEE